MKIKFLYQYSVKGEQEIFGEFFVVHINWEINN